MSFPQTQQVIDAIRTPVEHPAAEAVATLLTQYQSLTRALKQGASQVPVLREQIVQLQLAYEQAEQDNETLRGETQQLREVIATMEGHPDVKGARLVREKALLAQIERQKIETQKRIDEMEQVTPTP